MLINYKNIGDNLSDGDLNAISCLLRHNKTLDESIKILNGEVNGEYGDYTFNINSSTIVDNGILITDKTLTSLGTVRLSNPKLNKSTYYLELTVLTSDAIHIFDNEIIGDRTKHKITLELVENEEVQIPYTEIEKHRIISFQAKITIKHDKPIIKNP